MSNRFIDDPRFKLFSLSSNEPLAEKIADALGVKLGTINLTQFADGEIKLNVAESIRGSHVYIVQSTSNPVNEHLMELLIAIDACKRASARTINVVMPYYGYARQERKTQSREPITAKLVANMLTSAGATRMVTLDLHAAQIQGFFDIPMDHLLASPLIASHLMNDGLYGDDVVVVSPDHGGVTRARKLAEFLKSPIAIVDKRRPKANVAEVMHIVGDVKGKRCIIIDDMIDTAGTITLASQALLDQGATEVYACCTHPVLSGPAIERLEASPIKKVMITDSILLPKEKELDKIEQITVAKLVAEALLRIHEDRSVSPLFDEKF
ncbi:ribose-phosphate diphosphokinase [Falseniella ignava]|uniref:Ribose-phosphate pyrophosphokinase n=2 Tax=Falseniella ignava TaxID=137730 RepID=K1M9B7_9LACT|nr:ribose-phosphate diphosphokinase [Falseniella ignava]EKB58978.1 ribose-phosphate pyrophosphokinase 1 [Falseniella ignava CCUG 37419]PKY89637.1 ribose-phosphate pyrophosphokinase [Falseniella ignava]